MRAFYLAAFCGTLFTARGSEAPTSAPDLCTLTQQIPKKPEPSLTQCYRFNTLACCVSGHDKQVQADYENTFSANCLRLFPSLESLFCLGCHPGQPTFVDSTGPKPKIRICQTYADDVFALDLNRCGMNLKVKNPLRTTEEPAAAWKVGFYEPSDTRQVVLPTKVFDNVTGLLEYLKPPFFEGYSIEVVEDNGRCFSSARRASMSVLAVGFALAVSFGLF